MTVLNSPKGGAKKKGYIQDLLTKDLMKFDINPDSFRYGMSTEYSELKGPGVTDPMYEYVGGNGNTLNVQLYLNGQEERTSVNEWLHYLSRFHPSSNGHGNTVFTPPPKILFAYGTFVKTCIMESMDWEFTRFAPDLTPIEATVDISFKVLY